MNNHQIRHLRKYADDVTRNVARRLHSIDLLSADAGLYCIRTTEHLYRDNPGIRSRRQIIRLLLKLLKSQVPETKRVHTAGIENRLRFIQTGVSLDGCGIWKPEPESKTKQAGQQSPAANEIDEFLALHGYTEGNNGNS
jgi:hypothetical protein